MSFGYTTLSPCANIHSISSFDMYSGWVAANDLSQRGYDEYMAKTNPFAKK